MHDPICMTHLRLKLDIQSLTCLSLPLNLHNTPHSALVGTVPRTSFLTHVYRYGPFLISHLEKLVPAESIRKGQKVTAMKLKDEHTVRVTVQTEDAAKTEVLEASAVICTLPLGVLKHEHMQLFEPSLSESKAAAIREMGMGAENKVVLRFAKEDVFWPGMALYILCLGYAFAPLPLLPILCLCISVFTFARHPPPLLPTPSP